jgi:zinc transporter 2
VYSVTCVIPAVSSMSDKAITDDLAGADFTFDRTLSVGGLSGVTTEDHSRPGYCRNCSTQARMSGSDELWSRTGLCNTRGCRGYTGHPPAGRPQGLDHDEGSDDVPLLFSPLSSSPASHSSQELETMDHCHGLEPGREASKAATRQLSIAVVLCAIFVVGEVLGGYFSGSLAIMGDAAHMFSDLASFGLSLFVLWLGEKKPRKNMTFGFFRAEPLGALATLVIIWYVTGILVYLAINRIATGNFEVHGNAMLIVATCAVIFNVFLGVTLHGGLAACKHGHGHGGGAGHQHLGHGHSHGTDLNGRQINIRAALIHVLGDLLQSIGVLISSILIKCFGESFKLADPICTILFACIVMMTTFPVLKDTMVILLEATPSRLNYDTIYADLLSVKEVHRVHSLHMWSLTADLPCLSVHLTTSPGTDQETIRAQANRILRTKHQIFRTTLQVEIHQAQVMSECGRCQPLLV